jgi:hypothetical protein
MLHVSYVVSPISTLPMRDIVGDEPVLIRPKTSKERSTGMSREEAFSRCPSDSYVEFYGNQWLIVPFAPVEQPGFFVCTPDGVQLSA